MNRDLISEVLRNPEFNPHREIKTKAHAYALYEAGLFGNKALTWKTLEEIRKDNWEGQVCIRDLRGTDRSRKDSPLPIYNLSMKKLNSEVERLTHLGIPINAMTFNQSMPDDRLLVQGEILRFPGKFYHLTYSTIKKPMRSALLEETRYAKDLEARKIIRDKLSLSSLEELDHCLNFYSNNLHKCSAVVEFSAYDIPVGNLPGRNAVIWEVRNY